MARMTSIHNGTASGHFFPSQDCRMMHAGNDMKERMWPFSQLRDYPPEFQCSCTKTL